MAGSNHRRPLAVLAAVAVASIGVLAAPPAPVLAKDVTAAQVYEALGVDQIASDYVLLVDTSLSMRGPRYADVRNSLRQFFAALEPQDQVTLIPFAASAPARPVTVPAGTSPDALLARLPADAVNSNTDIGRAIEAALRVLGRRGAPSVATLVLLTDGDHDPAPGSRYPYAQGASWNALREQARRLNKDGFTQFAVPLADGATGASLLKQVFPRAEVLQTAAIGALSDRLERPKATNRAAKARQSIAPDLDRGIEVAWSGDDLRDLRAGDNSTTVTLRSTTEHIPLDVTGLTVESRDPRVTVRLDTDRVSLPPGGSVAVPGVVTWSPRTDSVLPWQTRSTAPRLALHGEASTPWAPVLTGDMRLAYAPKLPPAEVSGVGSTQVGHPYLWGGGLLVVLAAVILVLWLLRRRDNPPMYGLLTATASGSVLGTMGLRGQRDQRFTPSLGVPGSGEVTGRRSAGRGRAETVLRVIYLPKGAKNRKNEGTCALGDSVFLGGVRFHWTDGSTAVSAATPMEPPAAHLPPAESRSAPAEPAPTERVEVERVEVERVEVAPVEVDPVPVEAVEVRPVPARPAEAKPAPHPDPAASTSPFEMEPPAAAEIEPYRVDPAERRRDDR